MGKVKKGIKEWLIDLENNEELVKKFEGKETPEEIVALAKEEGYEFTVDEFMDLQMEMVSGGLSAREFFGGAFKFLGKARKKVSNFVNDIIQGL